MVAMVATFGGLLFGYDTGCHQRRAGPMTADLGLTPITEGIVTSSLLFGAAAGAVGGGRLSDAWGRRKTIILLAVAVPRSAPCPACSRRTSKSWSSAVSSSASPSAALSTVVPVYLAELAPYEIRGSLAGRNELMIVIGQLAAFVVNAVIGNVWGELAASGGSCSPSPRYPPSPCSSACSGCRNPRAGSSPRAATQEALAVLKHIRSPDRAEAEMAEVKHLAEEEKEMNVAGWGALKNKWILRILLVGIGLGVAQQLTGINSIMYYGQSVLVEAGFDSRAALIANIAPGVIAVVGGVIALPLMQRVNRRTTLLIGFILTTICHFLIGIASIAPAGRHPARPFVILFLVVAFVGSMQTFLNIAVWVMLSEIFPLHIRGFAIGISIFCLWIANAFLGLFFPSLVASVGITGTFFMFGVVGILALIFIYTQVPETRGRTLEALEEDVTTGAIYLVHKTPAPAAH